jgi:hypothetical protein
MRRADAGPFNGFGHALQVEFKSFQIQQKRRVSTSSNDIRWMQRGYSSDISPFRIPNMCQFSQKMGYSGGETARVLGVKTSAVNVRAVSKEID